MLNFLKFGFLLSLEDRVKKELTKTIHNNQYNGWYNRTTYGYHSYHLKGINIVGQRNPKQRIEEFKKFVDFNGKNVLDLGCNVGAMLHHLEGIKAGLGIDYDKVCINAARNIAKLLELNHLNYQVHDFDKDGYDQLKSKVSIKPDVIFVLSLGSWVKSWKELYSFCIDTGAQIIMEVNNEAEGEPQLQFFKEKNMNIKLIMDHSLDDMTGNNLRKTYLITHS